MKCSKCGRTLGKTVSKTFSVRINEDESPEKTALKLKKLLQKIEEYKQ